MLRADALALAAADAVRCHRAWLGVDLVVIVVGVPVVMGALRIQHGEQVGDGDMLRAARGAVAAGRAGDQVLFVENFLHLVHGGHLGVVQRLKVLHVAEVVLHLLHAAHAGQHHHDAGEAGRKANRVAGGAAAVQLVQHSLGIVGQVDKVAALDRLHDEHRLAVLAADFIALAALDGDVVIVQIVELDLHDLDLRVLGQNLVEHLSAVMERDAHVAHLALGLQLERRLVGAAVLEVLVVCRPLRVHEVEVEIVNAAGFELALEEGADVRLGLEEALGQLVGQDVLVTAMAARQALFQRQLALAVKIAVGGVKVVEALRQKIVDHLLRLLNVDIFALHRQAHTAKAKILLNFFHVNCSFHMGLPLMEIIASFNFKFKRQFVLPCSLPVTSRKRALPGSSRSGQDLSLQLYRQKRS